MNFLDADNDDDDEDTSRSSTHLTEKSKNNDFVEKDFTPSKNHDFRFSREKLFEIKRVFDAYDDDFDGVVSISHLETMLRAIGLILTRTDIAEMKKEIDVENRGAFELGAFFVIAARKFRDEHTVDAQARKAFLKISKSTLISGGDDVQISAIKTMLIGRGGEKLSGNELNLFMKIVEALPYKNAEITPGFAETVVSTKRLIEYVFEDRSLQETFVENQSEATKLKDQEQQSSQFKQFLHHRDITLLVRNIDREKLASTEEEK